jgi:hypothetical protein
LGGIRGGQYIFTLLLAQCSLGFYSRLLDAALCFITLCYKS